MTVNDAFAKKPIDLSENGILVYFWRGLWADSVTTSRSNVWHKSEYVFYYNISKEVSLTDYESVETLLRCPAAVNGLKYRFQIQNLSRLQLNYRL
jgi:hypothetical protein